MDRFKALWLMGPILLILLALLGSTPLSSSTMAEALISPEEFQDEEKSTNSDDVTTGHCNSLMPDGRIQMVSYTCSTRTGYRATVRYQKASSSSSASFRNESLSLLTSTPASTTTSATISSSTPTSVIPGIMSTTTEAVSSSPLISKSNPLATLFMRNRPQHAYFVHQPAISSTETTTTSTTTSEMPPVIIPPSIPLMKTKWKIHEKPVIHHRNRHQ